MISETETARLTGVLQSSDADIRLAGFNEIMPMLAAIQNADEAESLCRQLGFASYEELRRKFENTKATFRMRTLRLRAREQGLSPATLLVHAADRPMLKRFASELRRRRAAASARGAGSAQ